MHLTQCPHCSQKLESSQEFSEMIEVDCPACSKSFFPKTRQEKPKEKAAPTVERPLPPAIQGGVPDLVKEERKLRWKGDVFLLCGNISFCVAGALLIFAAIAASQDGPWIIILELAGVFPLLSFYCWGVGHLIHIRANTLP